MKFCRQQISQCEQEKLSKSCGKFHLSHVVIDLGSVKKTCTCTAAYYWKCNPLFCHSAPLLLGTKRLCKHFIHKILPIAHPNGVVGLTSYLSLMCLPPPAKHLMSLCFWMRKGWPLLLLGMGWMTLGCCLPASWFSLEFYTFSQQSLSLEFLSS